MRLKSFPWLVLALFAAGCQPIAVNQDKSTPAQTPAAAVTPAPTPERTDQTSPANGPKPNQTPAVAESPAVSPTPSPDSSYQPFTLAAYRDAKAAGRPIFLYFYANWCPLCRPQEPIVVELFASSDVRELGIAGFRVNYNDNETDDDERALARQLGVNYQHTFLTFDASGRQVWRVTGTQSREQLRTRLEEIQLL